MVVYTCKLKHLQTVRVPNRVLADGTANMRCIICKQFAYHSPQIKISQVFAETQRELCTPCREVFLYLRTARLLPAFFLYGLVNVRWVHAETIVCPVFASHLWKCLMQTVHKLHGVIKVCRRVPGRRLFQAANVNINRLFCKIVATAAEMYFVSKMWVFEFCFFNFEYFWGCSFT